MLEKVLIWLFPRLQLEGTPFYEGWHNQERILDVRFWRYLFFALALVSIAKGQFMPPAPTPVKWAQQHWALATLCFATAAAYCLPAILRARAYRYPAAISLLVFCYLVAGTMVGFGKEHYLVTFIVIIVAAWCLRTSVFSSVCFVAAAIYLQWDYSHLAGVSQAVAVSFSSGVVVFVAIARSDYAGRIRYYVAEQTMLATQEQAIEISIEFSDRIRAFLPKEISNRVTREIVEAQLSVQQAVEAVLRPKDQQICCLFTDIRGFTRGTKENAAFVSDGVIPNVVRCSRLVENHHGIPRKVGDLLFAYFDDSSSKANIVRCLSAAYEIVEANARFNQTNAFGLNIRRYLLVSTGTARVGNLGGLDTSIEISAEGQPVDLLGQMDQLTKSPQFREHVNETDIVLCPESANLVRQSGLECHLRQISLLQLGAPSLTLGGVETLWVLPMTEANKQNLIDAADALADVPLSSMTALSSNARETLL